MEIDYLRFILAALATFRIARFLPLDDGPFYIFKRMRIFTHKKALRDFEQKNRDKKEGEIPEESLSAWSNVFDIVTCSYCQGLYLSSVIVVLVKSKRKFANVILLIFAFAGAQTILQKWTEE